MQIKDKLLLPFDDWFVQLQAHHGRKGLLMVIKLFTRVILYVKQS